MSRIVITIEACVSFIDTSVSNELVFFPGALEAIASLRAQKDKVCLFCIRTGTEWSRLSGRIQNVIDLPLYYREEEAGKGEFCTDHGVTTYIDGSILDLSQLPESVTKRLWFRPGKNDLKKYQKLLKIVTPAETWADVLRKLS